MYFYLSLFLYICIFVNFGFCDILDKLCLHFLYFVFILLLLCYLGSFFVLFFCIFAILFFFLKLFFIGISGICWYCLIYICICVCFFVFLQYDVCYIGILRYFLQCSSQYLGLFVVYNKWFLQYSRIHLIFQYCKYFHYVYNFLVFLMCFLCFCICLVFFVFLWCIFVVFIYYTKTYLFFVCMVFCVSLRWWLGYFCIVGILL